MTQEFLDLDKVIDDRETKIIICCGSGGVGKTTTSAAIAVRAAEAGRKVVVLTIDPARRLAQSMGLGELDNTPRPVPEIDTVAGGSLDAMMLDMKRTFDDVVVAHSTPEKAAQILANPFYEALSSSFSGTQEYMAMEKLGQLHAAAEANGRWDLPLSWGVDLRWLTLFAILKVNDVSQSTAAGAPRPEARAEGDRRATVQPCRPETLVAKEVHPMPRKARPERCVAVEIGVLLLGCIVPPFRRRPQGVERGRRASSTSVGVPDGFRRYAAAAFGDPVPADDTAVIGGRARLRPGGSRAVVPGPRRDVSRPRALVRRTAFPLTWFGVGLAGGRDACVGGRGRASFFGRPGPEFP